MYGIFINKLQPVTGKYTICIITSSKRCIYCYNSIKITILSFFFQMNLLKIFAFNSMFKRCTQLKRFDFQLINYYCEKNIGTWRESNPRRYHPD